SATPKIAIIILYLNNYDALIACLQSCQNISYKNYEIILIENGSRFTPDLRANNGQMPFASLTIIHNPENLGYARGNNIGIREALMIGADYILLLNDDTVVSPDFLNILLDAGESNPDAGMLGPKIYYFDEPRKIWFAGAKFNSKSCALTTPGSDQLKGGTDLEPIESDYITGCALLINKAVIEKIGLLDYRYFLYWEDVDWGLRAKKAGFKNLVIPSAHIWHKVSLSSGGMDSLIRVYHKTRSHLLFAKLHAPKSTPKLHIQFFRDIAWLLLKSKDVNRFQKALAFIVAIRDYHIGKTDKGPQWIWNGYDKS
ncbi:MAG: glycosyltransferase family 2 protein, partial [bacterium]|nr:glycosyltransferase family 2 protein [bacterium]